jgi:hypothetical protein
MRSLSGNDHNRGLGQSNRPQEFERLLIDRKATRSLSSHSILFAAYGLTFTRDPRTAPIRRDASTHTTLVTLLLDVLDAGSLRIRVVVAGALIDRRYEHLFVESLA